MYRLAHFSAVLLLYPAGNDGAEVGAPPPPPLPGSDIASGGISAPDLAELDRLANEGGPHSAPDDTLPPPGPVSAEGAAIPERTPAEARAQHVAALEEHVRESATEELQRVFQTVKAELTKRESLPTATGQVISNPHEAAPTDPATRPIVNDSIRPLDLDYSIAHLQALWGRDASDLSSEEKGNVSKIVSDLRKLADTTAAKFL